MERVGSNGGTYTRLTKNNKYAYTWYLTAVTGPDYVDSNNDGLANGSDWGYWTTFNYGKWVESYQWRNPSQGFHRDVDATFQDFSTGQKQLYYLNSVATRTHTALFVKSFRADGKGVANAAASNPYGLYYSYDCSPPLPGLPGGCSYIVAFPAPQLKLNKVIILKNEDVPANMENKSSIYNTENYYGADGTIVGRVLSGENILDVADLNATATLTTNSVSSVVFSYNYSLCPGTINSWDESGASYSESIGIFGPNAEPLSGKLTLLQTQAFGQGGNGAMPATKFGYDLAQNEKTSGYVTIGAISNSKSPITLPPNSPFQAGDVLELTANSARITCALVPQASGALSAYYFGNVPTAGSYIASITKNPSYSKDSYDKWGMFKSDFNIDLAEQRGYDETQARSTNAVSAKNVDVWSLRTIRTPLGGIIKIKYGSDMYRSPIVERPQMVSTFGKTCTRDGIDGRGRIRFQNRLTVPASSVFYLHQALLISGVQRSPTNPRDQGTIDKKLVEVIEIQDNPSDPNEKNTIVVRDNSRSLWQSGGKDFWFGHITAVEEPNETYGGGIRVEKISLQTSGLEKSSKYDYENNGLISGVTSYEPGSYLPHNKDDCDDFIKTSSLLNTIATAEVVKAYKSQYYNALPHLLSLTRILPAPGVMYEFVTVHDVIKRQGEAELVTPQKTTFQFEVLKSNMFGLIGPPPTSVAQNNHDVTTREVALEDFTSRIGKLKRRTTYDTTGTKLNETINHYLHDDLDNATLSENTSTASSGYSARMNQFGYIGMIQENFGDSKLLRNSQGGYDTKVIMSHRNTYPVVLTGTTSTDYKTNITITTENKKFDFLSGQIISMLSTDGYGNKILSESKPAYRVYPALGPKMGTNAGRNMLTQTAANAQYKVDAQGNKMGVIAATASTWSTSVSVLGTTPATPEIRGTQATVWRPQSSYSWQAAATTANGLTPMTGATGYVDFFAGVGSPSWRKTTEVTLYDVYSNALEASDINGKYVATKKGYEQSRVLMTGGPASYNEIVYSGLEDATKADGTLKRSDGYLSGGVSLAWPIWNWGSGDVSVITGPNRPAGSTHTGNSSVRIKYQKHGLSYRATAPN